MSYLLRGFGDAVVAVPTCQPWQSLVSVPNGTATPAVQCQVTASSIFALPTKLLVAAIPSLQPVLLPMGGLIQGSVSGMAVSVATWGALAYLLFGNGSAGSRMRRNPGRRHFRFGARKKRIHAALKTKKHRTSKSSARRYGR